MIFHYFSREFEKIYFYQKGIKFEKNIRISDLEFSSTRGSLSRNGLKPVYESVTSTIIFCESSGEKDEYCAT